MNTTKRVLEAIWATKLAIAGVGGIAVAIFLATYLKTHPIDHKTLSTTATVEQVAGESATLTQGTPTPTTIPTPTTFLVDCIGPDGKHAQATQTDCANLNSFWNTHTPKPETSGASTSTNGGNTNSEPTPTPTTTPTTDNPTPTPQSTGISVNTNSVVITLSRQNVEDYDKVFGTGFVVTNHGATGFSIGYTTSTSGQGFYESAAGLAPGSTYTVRSYISTNKTNGTYTGSALLYWTDSSGQSHDGPTITYTITLTD